MAVVPGTLKEVGCEKGEGEGVGEWKRVVGGRWEERR